MASFLMAGLEKDHPIPARHMLITASAGIRNRVGGRLGIESSDAEWVPRISDRSWPRDTESERQEEQQENGHGNPPELGKRFWIASIASGSRASSADRPRTAFGLLPSLSKHCGSDIHRVQVLLIDAGRSCVQELGREGRLSDRTAEQLKRALDLRENVLT